jgi:uncharacterized protein (TIGR02145 family)
LFFLILSSLLHIIRTTVITKHKKEMKRTTILLTILLCMATMFAQAPQKFSYQAVVRNASNALVTNAPVGVRISVLQGGIAGTIVYMETHTAVTNENGLMTLLVGSGNLLQGDFTSIDWANGLYYLKTEIDPNGGTNYSITSTQQLLSVPYALYANEAGNGFSGDYNDLTNTPVIPVVPTELSAFNNDMGYITEYTETDPQFNAWNKNYDDLINKPTIPTVPTNVSAFTNDAGYLTSYTETDPQFNAWDKDYNDLINKPTIPAIPTNVSTFNNDANYVTTSQLNAANYITAAQVPVQVNADWSATTGVAQILNKPTLFSGNYNDLTNKPTLFSGNYNDLTNKPTIPTVPTVVSAFTNDAGYITAAQVPAQVNADWNATSGVAQILHKPTLFSGDYNDLTNKPTIPTVPTNVSAFTNDAGYLTSYAETDPQFNAWDKNYNDLTNKPTIPTIPTNVSAFTNDAGYLTSFTETDPQFNAWDKNYNDLTNKPTLFSGNYNDLTNKPSIPTVPTNVSVFTNDAGYITNTSIPSNVSTFVNDAGYLTNYTETDPQFNAWDKNYDDLTNKPTLFSGNYNDLTNKPIIPTVPTNVSAFTNDAGYLISFTEQQVLSISHDTLFLTGGSFVKLPSGFDGDYNSLTNKPVIFSGNYNDLTNKPTIPTVPTNVSSFNNDAGYLTNYTETDPQFNAWDKNYNDLTNKPILFDGNYNSLNNKPNLATVATTGNYNDLTNKPTIPTVPTNVSVFNNDAGYITAANVQEAANIPTNVSAFNNDAGYITAAQVPAQVNVDWNATSGVAKILNKPTLFSGNYNDLTNKPVLFDGNYNSLSNKPNLATVATTGNYNDLTNMPALFSGNYNDLTNKPTLFSGNYNDLANKPNLATVATTGNYNDLSNKPTIPTVPSNVSVFNNDAHYITEAQFNALLASMNNTIDSLRDRIEELETNPPTPEPEFAAISTISASYITESTAQSGGNITSDGGSSVTARGICWSTSHNPTINGNHTYDGSGKGSYVSILSELASGTTYYVRAYATNGEGTFYGNEVSFTTPTPFSCGTSTVTDFDGNIYHTVQIGGQCWMKENMRTTHYATGTTITQADVSQFSATIRYYYTGSGQTYGFLYNWPAIIGPDNVRANNQGVCPAGWHVPGDGEWGQLTTYVGSQSNYQCSNNPNNYAKALASNTGWNISTTACTPGNNQSSNNATGFSALPAGYIYNNFFRGSGYEAYFWSVSEYSDNGASGWMMGNASTYMNTGVYGYVNKSYGCSVRCLRDEGNTSSLPILSTSSVSSITTATAVAGGNITSTGNSTVTARGVCWSTFHSPTVSDNHTNNGKGTGSFTSNITGLSPGTKYYVRAYAINGVGISYGGEKSFTTQTPTLPTLTTTVATSITTTSASSGGYITDGGNSSITARGVCWSTMHNPTTDNSHTVDGTGPGNFTSNLTGLSSATTYYVRAYAVNEAGTNYGDEVSFTTLTPTLPSLTTTAVTSITTTTATAGGNITNSGNSSVTVRGICWSTSHNPTVDNNHTDNGTGTGSFTGNLTGLNPGTTYYVRAYAVNGVGTNYGNEVSFTTQSPFVCGTSTVSDYDNNEYNTVQIGSQCWMKENMRTTHYANGTSITKGSTSQASTSTRYYYKPSNSTVYGYLYNWPATIGPSSVSTNNQGVCPTGWHVPSDGEWTQLIQHVGSQSQYVCNNNSYYVAKALASTTGWSSSSYSCDVGYSSYTTNNATGFCAYPAGYFALLPPHTSGVFDEIGDVASFWTCTASNSNEAYSIDFYYDNSIVDQDSYDKSIGYSVRCVRN